MFMFTFSVITISIVGLFFQIVQAMTAYLLAQQLSLGEQMLKWHAAVYSNSCAALIAKASGDTVIASELPTPYSTDYATICPSVAACTWHSQFFTGTYNGAASNRLLVTYVGPTEQPSGYSAAVVAQQLNKITLKQRYHFNRVSGGSINFTTFDSSNPGGNVITITGLPAPDNSVALVSDARCN